MIEKDNFERARDRHRQAISRRLFDSRYYVPGSRRMLGLHG